MRRVALVALNVGLALALVLGYARLDRPCEQRIFGVLGAFLVALYAEIYGFLLTIYPPTVVLGRVPFPPSAHSGGNLIASLWRLTEG